MKRLLAIILASLMILSSATAGASAYQAYKDDALTKYDYTDSAVLTTEQYASAILDDVDKMLKKENINEDLSVLGTLDATSIDNALDSVYDLINSNKLILWMAGDLNSIKVTSIKTNRRSNSTDVQVIKDLLSFLNDNKSVLKKVVVGGIGKQRKDGGFSLGVANSFVDMELDISKMVREMLWETAYGKDVAYVAGDSRDNIDNMLQAIIDTELGDVEEIPASVLALLNINSTKSVYDLIEDILQVAYNDIAVDMLNDDLMPWLENEIAKNDDLKQIFKTGYKFTQVTVPSGKTFVDELNNILGDAVGGLMKNYTGWVEGDNSKLTSNIMALGRFILKETGDSFFPAWQKHIATAEEIDAMTDDQLVAYVARSIINGSVGYMYIDDTVTTTVGVTWEAVKQLMAQFVPERDYSSYPKTVQGILDMLADYAVYSINSGMDLNAGSLRGGLEYGQGLDKTLTTIIQWAAADPQYYLGLFPDTTVDTTNGWAALDDILFKLLDKSILPAKYADSSSATILKTLIYDILNGLLVNTNLSCITDLFVRNENGVFATQTLKQSVVRLVTDVLNAILPGTITATYTTLDSILNNDELGTIVVNLISSLNTNKDNLVPPIMNIVAQVMGVVSKSKFGQMKFNDKDRATGDYTITVKNGSKGINKGFTAKDGTFTQDALYKYSIVSISAVAYDMNGNSVAAPSTSGLSTGSVMNGGEEVDVSVTGVTDDSLVILTIKYHVLVEDGSNLTSEPLIARTYTYVKSVADVDQGAGAYSKDKGPTHNKNNADITFTSTPGLVLFNQNNKDPFKTIENVWASVKNSNDTKYYVSNETSYAMGDLTDYFQPSDAYLDDENYKSDSNYTPHGILVNKDDNKTVRLNLWELKDGVSRIDSFPVGSDYTLKYGLIIGRTATLAKYEAAYHGTTRFITYNDYKLPSLVNSAISANRDRSLYESGSEVDTLWANYESALLKAALLTKRPGMIAQYSDASYLAQFETAYNALEEAIYQLDGGKKYADDKKTQLVKDYGEGHRASASVASLFTAVEAVSGKANADDAVYWDSDYTYFGYDDFNGVAWSGWKEARNRALNLYNSTFPPEEPQKPKELASDATLYDQSQYNKKLEKYEKNHAAWEKQMAEWTEPVISATDVAYAEQQVKLWGPRILGWKVDAVKTHLDSAITLCTIDSSNASQYDAERWESYAKSLAYAQAVSSSFKASTTMRTQVREAMNNLIYNWKRLTYASVVPVTFTFTVNGTTHATLVGNQGDAVDMSTVTAPSAPVGQHFVGWGNVPATFDKDTTFEAIFANNTDTKYTVNVYQMDTTGNYPSTPTNSYQGAGETGSTADVTSSSTAAEGFTLDTSKSTLSGTIAGDGSLVLSVYYKRNQYNIILLNTDLPEQKYYYGAVVSLPTPEKENHSFIGWDGEVPTTMPAKHVTLTAQWSENPANYDDYNIAKANGQAAQQVADYEKTYTAESRQALADALAKDVSGKKISEQSVVDAQTAAINAAIAGLEKMTYNAIFMADGKLHATVPTKVGEQIVAPANPEKGGYSFTGWTPAVGTMGTEDITFTAQFSAGNSNYTVNTYIMDTDGNYGDATPETKVGTTDTAATVTPEVKTGFTVDTSKSVLSGTVTADGKLVLSVYYKRNQHTLSVDGNETLVYYGAAVTVSQPADRDGYTWNGWNESVPATMPDEDVTITSNWSENDANYTAYDAAAGAAALKKAEDNFDKKYTKASRDAIDAALAINVSGLKYSQQSQVDAATKAINDAVAALELMSYKVTFVANDKIVSETYYKVGETITVPEVPYVEGFVGNWDKTVTTMGLEDITVTAVYTAGDVSYKVETYVMDVNGDYGDATVDTKAAKTGEAVSVTPDERTGFTVDASKSVLSGTVAADSSTVLKVYYSRNQYKLSVDGTVTDVYYGAALDFGTPDAREGWTFTGWSSDATTMPAENLTVTSNWDENAADYTAYNAAKTAAQTKQNEVDFAKRYTEASRNALAAAIEKDVSGKKYSQQSEVDAQTAAINDAVAGLKKMTYNAIFMSEGSVYETIPVEVDAKITVPAKNPEKGGWTFSKWNPTPDTMGVEDMTFVAEFVEGGSSYTVKTYVMGTDGEYTLEGAATPAAKTNSTATVTPDERTGFTVDNAKSVLSGTVAADGSLVLEVYYSRNKYTLSVDGTETDVYYGAALDFGTPAAREGWTFTGWSSDATTMPAENLTVTSNWSEDGAKYAAYNKAVAAANAKRSEDNYEKMYTKASRDAVDAAVAINVSGLKYSQQSEVDAATKAINDAVAALELMSYKVTFVANNNTVSEQYYKVGETITVPEVPYVEGFVGNWDKTVTTMGLEDITVTAVYSAGDVSYKVETYVMDVNGNYGDATVDTKAAKTGEAVSVTPDERTGFTVDASKSVLSGTVAADSSTVLKVYYSRNQYKLSVDGTVTDVYYGAAVTVSQPADRDGWTWLGWNESVPATMPAENVTLTSNWSENDADYTAYDMAVSAAESVISDNENDKYYKLYTKESRDVLSAALAVNVQGKKYSQQNEVDAATQAINDAVRGLERMSYKAIFAVNGSVVSEKYYKVGEQIVAPADPEVEGFIFTGWTPEVGKMGLEDVSFNATFKAGTVSYKIETYVMGLDGEYVLDGTETKGSATGTAITVTPDARTGFTVAAEMSTLSGTVAADSSTVLKVYYSRNQYKLSVDGTETDVYYGAALDFGTPDAREGWTFTGWSSDATTMPAENLTVTSNWSENDANYSKVTAAIASVPSESDLNNYYTAESVAAVKAAVDAVVYGKKYSEQSVVDGYATAIETAVSNLVLIPADKTALAAAIGKCDDLNNARYTEDTWSALTAAIANGITLYNNGNLTKKDDQSRVDAAAKAIEDAIKALELRTYDAIFMVNGEVYATVPTKVDSQIVAPKAPTVDGSNFTGWDKEVGIMGTEDITFTAQFVANNSSIISVKAEEPNYGGMHQYVVEVKGNPDKIQIIDAYGTTRTLARNTSMTSDATAYGILNITATEDGELWTINVNLPEGNYTAKAKVGKTWESETRSFTVAYDEQPTAAPGSVLDFSYATPNYGGKQNYSVKVSGKAEKIHFAAIGGGTRTYSRTNSNVTIKSYDADGHEVYASSTNIAYEIWTVNVALEAGDYAIKAKYDGKWGNTYSANVTISEKVVSTVVSVTEATANDNSVVVTVNGTAQKVQIVYANGSTRTYNRDNAAVSIASTDAGEVWTIDVKLPAGEYTARAKYINDAGKQVWDSTSTAFTVA